MDLNALDTSASSNEGVKMEVEGIDGATILQKDGKPVTITLLGIDSETMQKRQNELTNDTMKKGFRPKPQSAEKMRSERVKTLALATVTWDGVEIDGKELTFSYENALSLYRRLPALAEQVDNFVGDRANFTKK